MAVNLSPVGGVAAQFFTNSGAVLTGGKIYTYAAGTSTPQATYTTSAGNVAWTNPIVLDAAGRVPSGGEIWLTDGLTYKFLLKDSNDVLIATYDNISGINSNFVNYSNQQEIQTATAGQTVFTLTTMQYQPSTGSLSVFVDGVNQYGPGAQYAYVETNDTTVTFNNGLHVGASVKFTTSAINSSSGATAAQTAFTGFKGQTGNVQDLAGNDGSDWIGFEQSGVGAVARSAQDKMREMVSVKDFGAVGNGVADDTAAINSALLTGGAIFMPAGAYLISSPIRVPNYTSLNGEDRFTTTIRLKAGSNCNLVEPYDLANGGVGCGLSNLSFDGNQNNNTKGGVYLSGANFPTASRGPTWIVDNITVSYCREVDFGSGFKPAVYLGGNQWSVLNNIDIINNDYAQAALWVGAADCQINGLYIGTNGRSRGSASYGLYVTSGGNFFNSCYFGGTQNNAQVWLSNAGANTFNNCIIDNSGTDGLWLGAGSTQNKFIGGQIGNSSYSDGGTYYSILSDTVNGNNIFSGVTIYSEYATAYATNGYKESAGTNGGNHVVGCQFIGTFTGGADGRSTTTTTQIVGCKGVNVTNVGTLQASTKLDVQGAYTNAAPSTSSVPLGRFHNGAVSLWAASKGYDYAWLQAIQDDGANTIKPLYLQPLGGSLVLGGNGNGITVTSPNGLITKTISIDNSGNVVAV